MNSPVALQSLQQRIDEMQPLRLDERALPTLTQLTGLLPGGALRRGASYSVHGSLRLALALLAGPSAAGSWCGVVGCASIGAEAAAEVGVALDRCVFVPQPGAHAVGIAGSLAEVLTVMLLAPPPAGVLPREAARVAARLREHGSALIVLGDWPQAESALRVTATRWGGLSTGAGLLDSCELSVESRDHRGRRTHTVPLVTR